MSSRRCTATRALVALTFAIFVTPQLAVAHGVWCRGAVVHPVSARVEALDPVRRGATVRLVVVAESAVGLERAEARLTHAGAAHVLGATRVQLGSLRARTPRETTFRVVVPANGDRALVQFRIEGEGPAGKITRGVAFNLLPDGPTQIGHAATAGDGTHLLEYEARTVQP